LGRYKTNDIDTRFLRYMDSKTEYEASEFRILTECFLRSIV